jgi:U3 small nucleolar RNA-associated protein 20
VSLCAGDGLLSAEQALTGRLAFLFYKQMEEDAADDALLSQATKNLVFLAPRLYSTDLAAGRVPKLAPVSKEQSGDEEEEGSPRADGRTGQQAAAGGQAMLRNTVNGTGYEEVENAGEKDDAEDAVKVLEADGEGAEGVGSDGGTETGALTLHGLVRRMARLADDRAWPRTAARLAALRFAAALASRLGRDAVAPYLPILLVPLYRITEGDRVPSPDEVCCLILPSVGEGVPIALKGEVCTSGCMTTTVWHR